MRKKSDGADPTPQKEIRDGVMKKPRKHEIVAEKKEGVFETALESSETVDENLEAEPIADKAEEEVNNEELSEMLSAIEEGVSVEEEIDVGKEGDAESLARFFRDQEDTTGRAEHSEPRPLDESKTDDEIVADDEAVEEKPKSRWLITTCRYCGNMYRFRSDQIQPPTCERPKCVQRYEENSKKKLPQVARAV